MATQLRTLTLTFAAANEIQRHKIAPGATGININVNGANPGVTFEVATCRTEFTEFTGSGTGVTSIPNTSEFNNRERSNGEIFSVSNPFDSEYGWGTDILIRVSAPGTLNVEETSGN
jgi:hypothetical protein